MLVRNLKHGKILQHSQLIFPLGIHTNYKDIINPITFTFEQTNSPYPCHVLASAPDKHGKKRT